MNFKEAVIALIFFAVVTLIFFYKILFGLIPLPTDLIVGAYYPWLSYKWENYNIGVPVHNPKLSDAVSLYYPFKSLAADFERKGELPLWNPYIFGGYPLFANVQAGLFFPTMIFYLLFSSPIAWTLQVMSQPFFASFFMYLLLRHFGLKKLPGIFGSIAYGFGGFTILWMQWNTQATTSMFLPILILLEDRYLTSKSLRWGASLSIFIALQILAGYLPIIPLTLIGMAMWYLFRSKKYISDLKILLFIILGLSLSAIFLLPVFELINISQRTVETLGGSSPFVSLKNFITAIAPDFFGNDATGNFWGSGDHMDFTLYSGATTLIFALLGIKYLWNKIQVKFAISLFLIVLVITIANPLSAFLYKLGVWGGNSITMNRANFLINFSLSILGAYGISLIKISYLKLSLKLGIGFLVIPSIIIAALLYSETSPHINISLRNLVLPVLLITTVLFLIFLLKKFNFFRSISAYIFVLILIIELFRNGWKFNTFSSVNFIYPNTPITEFLEKFPNDRFVAENDVIPANMWIPFKLSSITGYDGIYPLSAAQLLATANSGKSDTPPQPRWGILENFDSKILDETNTRFIVAVKRDNSGKVSEDGQISNKLKMPKYKEVFSDKGVIVLENTQALPRTYLTKNVIKSSDKEALKLMIDKSFPISTTSIADFKWSSSSSEDLKSDLRYKQITNSRVLINTTSNIEAFLVILDSFYPGWKVFIDGQESIIHKTNYNFRGIMLPRGTHTVEFIYTPESLKYGIIISGVSLTVIFALLIIPGFIGKKR